MYLSIGWTDPRLKLYRVTEKLEKFYQAEGEQRKIWSPQIIIGANKVFQNKQGLEYGLSKTGRSPALVYKNVHLTTKVKCQMDFPYFPFDKHTCILQVRK